MGADLVRCRSPGGVFVPVARIRMK